MKTISLCFLIYLVLACSAPPSQETASLQDTTAAALSTDSVRPDVTDVLEKPKEQPLTISDSSASRLNDLVTSQFAKFYADSANYYKVVLTDYFDEYEGQDEMTITTWYYDQDFSIAYSRKSYQNGAMRLPDIDEYLLKDNSIVSAKGERDDRGDKEFLRWDVEAGGIILVWSSVFDKIQSSKAIRSDYLKVSQAAWTASMEALPYELDKEKIVKDDGNMITLLTENRKPSELMDYTRVTISKVLFDRLTDGKN
ncbi:hypothetical protein BH09BAC3_BH09BAC3_37170 [soil metagenome]